MSPPGRPKGEFRRAQPGGLSICPPGRPQGEFRRAQPEGSPASGSRRAVWVAPGLALALGLAALLSPGDAWASEDEVPAGCESSVKAIGMPAVNGDGRAYKLLCRTGQLLAYGEEFKTPIWVVERLSADRFQGTADRSELCAFKADPDLPAGAAAVDADYRGKSKRDHRAFDRGHMAPAADMKWNATAMAQSCYLSNVAPQQGLNLNRHIWADLEALVRDWACDREDLYVITGPIYDEETPDTLGASEVAVPTAFFKVAFEPRKKRVIAFILPNKPVPRSGNTVANVLAAYVQKPGEVERRAGITLFTALPPRDRTRLKLNVSPVWGVVQGCKRGR